MRLVQNIKRTLGLLRCRCNRNSDCRFSPHDRRLSPRTPAPPPLITRAIGCVAQATAPEARAARSGLLTRHPDPEPLPFAEIHRDPPPSQRGSQMADATWYDDPPSGDYNGGTNWVDDSPPGTDDTALFNVSNITEIYFTADATNVGGWTFDCGQTTYSFFIAGNQSLSFRQDGIRTISGHADLTVDGFLGFGTAGPSAGNARITIDNGGLLFFSESGTAGAATIYSAGGISFGGQSSMPAARRSPTTPVPPGSVSAAKAPPTVPRLRTMARSTSRATARPARRRSSTMPIFSSSR